MRRQPRLGVQHQCCGHEGVALGLAEVDGLDPGRLAPGEPLQEPAEEHDAHGGAERRRDAAAAAGAEGDEPQVILGECDVGRGGEVAVRVEAQGLVPHARVAAQPRAAQDHVAALGDAVAGDGGVGERDVRDVERRHRVQPERLPDAGLHVV